MNEFHYALSLALTLYGVDFEEEDFEEIALVGWNLIGNKRTKLYRYSVCMDSCEDNKIELPCNCDILEAVTTGWEDWSRLSNMDIHGNLPAGATELYIEQYKDFHDPLYLGGKFIKYERVGNTLYLDRPYRLVNILYKGVILDDNGLPELTDKEALALATYCAYVSKYKEGVMTSNPNLISIANTLLAKWVVLCDLARTDEYLSQNDWDNIMDAKTNWDRKIFRKSFKLYK